MNAPESATERLGRLLALVPWLVKRPGVPLADAAAAFGVSEEQLVADLQLLFVCGTPGHMPDDLIEAEWEDGFVYVGNADAIAQPLRLSVDEAVTLIVGLRTIASAPGVRDAVDRALAKLESATAGLTAEETPILQVDIDAGDQRLAAAREAIEAQRRVRLRYLVPHRDEVTERDVDLIRAVNLDSHWYLEGYCHLAADTRLFRVDRIEQIDILDVPGRPPAGVQPRDLAAGTFVARETDTLVVLLVDAATAWLADYYPTEAVEPLPDGGTRVTLRVADVEWITRLVVRLGGHARVDSPPQVIEAVHRRAAAALAAYEPSSTP